jgi:hypothetical protein
MPQAGVICVSRALPPVPTNPRNCLEITLVFNGCDPAFLQSCYDRPDLASHPTVACGFSTSNALFCWQWISLRATTIAGRTAVTGARSRQRMAKEGQGIQGFESILGAAGEAARKGPPPVHLWDPPFCGDLDMRISSDGTWHYLKTPIGRPALVKLFASVLKREGDRYFLVTPVEKVGITVDDAPFLAVELKVEEQNGSRRLHFRTNVDDWVACGAGHGLRFEPEPATGGLKPYLHVRRDLWAKVTRALFYDLVELGEERDVDGVRMFGVASGDQFFVMAPADSLKEFA